MNLKGLVKPELKERFLNLLQTPHTNWYTGGTYYTNPNLVWKLKRVRVIGNSRYKTLRNFPNTETCNEVNVHMKIEQSLSLRTIEETTFIYRFKFFRTCMILLYGYESLLNRLLAAVYQNFLRELHEMQLE